MANNIHNGQLYTAKQLSGGFILAFSFFILLIITLSFVIKDIDVKNYYFTSPILVSLAYSLLAYIFVFNETVNLNNKMANEVDDFSFNECPNGFTKKIDSINGLPITKNTNIKCIPNETNKTFTDTFYLSGDTNNCSLLSNNKNGCFNKNIGREKKCNAVKQFFSEHQTLLDNWNDYADNCIY